jgi:hypothetical protein
LASAPSHAALATGAHPSAHGLIDNVWLDRVSGQLTYTGPVLLAVVAFVAAGPAAAQVAPKPAGGVSAADLAKANNPRARCSRSAGRS